MTWIADVHNNPFFVDDETLPPQRSALAVLLAERDELLDNSVESLLERARRRLRDDPQLATVYGRSITEDELTQAAARLSNPQDRLINELLDFRFHPFDLKGIPELSEATRTFRGALSRWDWPELADLSLIATILRENLPPVDVKPLQRCQLEKPEIPSLGQSLDALD